jgi:hypothetical protein
MGTLFATKNNQLSPSTSSLLPGGSYTLSDTTNTSLSSGGNSLYNLPSMFSTGAATETDGSGLTQDQLNTKLASDLQLRNQTQLNSIGQNQGTYSTQASLLNSALNNLGLDDRTVEAAIGRYDTAEGDYDYAKSGWRRTADQGKYDQNTYNNLVGNAERQVADTYKAAAANSYNKSLGQSINPFGAASILAKGASEAGRAKADEMSKLAKEQADSKQTALGQLSSLVNTGVSIANAKAGIDMKRTNPTTMEIINSLKDKITSGRASTSTSTTKKGKTTWTVDA